MVEEVKAGAETKSLLAISYSLFALSPKGER